MITGLFFWFSARMKAAATSLFWHLRCLYKLLSRRAKLKRLCESGNYSAPAGFGAGLFIGADAELQRVHCPVDVCTSSHSPFSGASWLCVEPCTLDSEASNTLSVSSDRQ